MRRLCLTLASISLLCFSSAGCGGSAGQSTDVSGQVTLDGMPFSQAGIVFTAIRSGAAYESDLDAEGRYRIHLLGIQSGDEFGVSFGPKKAASGDVKVDPAAGTPVPNPPPPIPKKYFEYKTSGLTAKLGDSAEQKFDFPLNSK